MSQQTEAEKIIAPKKKDAKKPPKGPKIAPGPKNVVDPLGGLGEKQKPRTGIISRKKSEVERIRQQREQAAKAL